MCIRDRHAGARAVDNPDGADPGDNGVIEIFVDDFQPVLNMAADDVAFQIHSLRAQRLHRHAGGRRLVFPPLGRPHVFQLYGRADAVEIDDSLIALQLDVYKRQRQ